MAEAVKSRVDLHKIKALLGKLPIFSGLWDEELDDIIHICKTSKAQAGEPVFEEGDPSDAMYVMLSGMVEIRTQRAGRLHVMLPGDNFGEIGMITQRRRTASAVPTAGGDLITINRVEFNNLLGRAPRISAIILRNLTEQLAGHLVRMNNRAATTEFVPRLDGD